MCKVSASSRASFRYKPDLPNPDQHSQPKLNTPNPQTISSKTLIPIKSEPPQEKPPNPQNNLKAQLALKPQTHTPIDPNPQILNSKALRLNPGTPNPQLWSVCSLILAMLLMVEAMQLEHDCPHALSIKSPTSVPFFIHYGGTRP